MGVTLSVTSLVMALAQDRPDEYKGSYSKAAQRLKKIAVDGEIAEDYLYYKVPCPWIQVKFLKLLQYFPPSGKRLLYHLRMFGSAIIDEGRRQAYPRPDATLARPNFEGCAGDAEKCTAKQRAKCNTLRGN